MKKIVELYKDELEQKKAELRAAEVYYIFGEHSIFVPKLATTFVDRSSLMQWPDIYGEYQPMTPGQAARMELRRAFPYVRLRARKSDFTLLDIAPPMYFSGQRQGELWYFDLVSAYWQLYRKLWLDVAWPRGTGIFSLYNVARRLQDWKPARNSIVGISRSHSLTAMKNGKLVMVATYNPYFNPALWHTIQNVLHEIATYALYRGAIYIATDCYIFRNLPRALEFRRFLEDYHLVYRLEQGDGHIRGWGSYKVGSRATKRTIDTDRKINNIVKMKERTTLEWLKKVSQGM